MLTKEHHHNKFCLATFRKLNKPLKPTVISISMTTVMTGAVISFALGLIAQTFPDASPTMIKLILTAPSLMIIPLSFLSSYLTTVLDTVGKVAGTSAIRFQYGPLAFAVLVCVGIILFVTLRSKQNALT